jgi:hypothetical protein
LKLRRKALFVFATSILVASCGDPPSSPSIPEILINAFGGDEVTHYGYINDRRYEAGVDPDDLRESDTVESAMPPNDAVILAEPALVAIGEDPRDFVVCGVDLTRHVHQDRYYYLVAFCGEHQPDSVGFRVPVLLSGQVIQPELAEDQS